ncbi:MAG: cupredoxin domain-containing protein [Rickettsiales bacterium]|nr:cupredoxin domain-containing protein [Rickettsiales bacterium]
MKFLTLALTLALIAVNANAMETREIIIKDHKFIPEVLTIPADTRVKLLVKNQDPTAAEFESDDFKREKILPGNSQANIFIPALPVGEYKFFDEFNVDTTQGILKVE